MGWTAVKEISFSMFDMYEDASSYNIFNIKSYM